MWWSDLSCKDVLNYYTNGNVTITFDIKDWVGRTYNESISTISTYLYLHFDDCSNLFPTCYAGTSKFVQLPTVEAYPGMAALLELGRWRSDSINVTRGVVTEQEDCMMLRDSSPHSYRNDPLIVDLPPNTLSHVYTVFFLFSMYIKPAKSTRLHRLQKQS